MRGEKFQAFHYHKLNRKTFGISPTRSQCCPPENSVVCGVWCGSPGPPRSPLPVCFLRPNNALAEDRGIVYSLILWDCPRLYRVFMGPCLFITLSCFMKTRPSRSHCNARADMQVHISWTHNSYVLLFVKLIATN